MTDSTATHHKKVARAAFLWCFAFLSVLLVAIVLRRQPLTAPTVEPQHEFISERNRGNIAIHEQQSLPAPTSNSTHDFQANEPPQSIALRLTAALEKLSDSTDLTEIDALAREFLETASMTRKEKLALLLSLLLRNPRSFGLLEQYACDLIGVLQPIEYAEELISAFNTVQTDAARIALLHAIKSTCILRTPPDEVDPQILEALKTKAPLVERFLRDLLSAGNQTLLPDVLGAYCAIATPDDSANMAVSVLNDWLALRRSDELLETDVSPENLLQQVVESGLATSSTQDRVFAVLPTLLKTFSADEIATFHEYLYRVVASADLTPKAQSELSAYLLSREPSPSATSSFFHWANSMARVSGGMDPVYRLELLGDILVGQTEPLNRASMIVYGPIEVLDTVPTNEARRIQSELRNYLLSAAGDDSEIAQTAIETIDEYFNGTALRTPQIQRLIRP